MFPSAACACECSYSRSFVFFFFLSYFFLRIFPTHVLHSFSRCTPLPRPTAVRPAAAGVLPAEVQGGVQAGDSSGGSIHSRGNGTIATSGGYQGGANSAAQVKIKPLGQSWVGLGCARVSGFICDGICVSYFSFIIFLLLFPLFPFSPLSPLFPFPALFPLFFISSLFFFVFPFFLILPPVRCVRVTYFHFSLYIVGSVSFFFFSISVLGVMFGHRQT